MRRLLLFGLVAAVGCGGGGSSGTPVAAFLLPDVNVSSPTSGQNVSPRDYMGSVSAWFFGDGASAYSNDQFGLLDRMQDELWIENRTLRPNDSLQILGVNKIGADADVAAMTAGRDLPVVQDTLAAGVQSMWAASDFDLVILDESNVPLATYGLAANDLATPAVYEEVKALLRGGPAELAPDFLVMDVNPNSPTSGQNVSPRDYVGKVSGYYFGAAT